MERFISTQVNKYTASNTSNILQTRKIKYFTWKK